MDKRESERILRFFAIFAIYLIISLTFLTAQALAVLNYEISGEDGALGYARADNDFITIHVNASSEVSFESDGLGSISLTGCEETSSGVSCTQTFEPADIDPAIGSIPFTLTQPTGAPSTKEGVLNIDSEPPAPVQFDVTPEGTGLRFQYTFRDYQSSTTEGVCKGSGIGYISIRFQNTEKFTQSIKDTYNCTVSGTYFLNLSGTYVDKATYAIIVRDRVGNEYSSGPKVISGDFKPPIIHDSFKVIRSGEELTGLSSAGEVTADLVVEVEDADLGPVYGDLSKINLNPAVNMNPGYINAISDCIKDSGNLYICTFRNMRFKPNTESISITITASDNAGNKAVKQITKTFNIKDNAGSVLYLGPSKDQCTQDLKSCYVKSGRQLLYAELDTSSSYNRSIINLGIDSERTFSICRLNTTWKCTGVFTIDSTSNMFIAESYDDYGNMLESDTERTLYLDDDKPRNLTSLKAVNSNNNNNCSVSGDELTFTVNVSESSPELKIYVNTSGFASQEIQRGTCEKLENGNYECTLTVKGFSSVASSNVRDIVLEDLAGNALRTPYKFDVCRSTSDRVPNVIFEVTQASTPKIDRRTANKISVKTYIPLSLRVQPGATLMYLNIERCTAQGVDGLNVMGTGHSLLPNYGNNPTLALYVGHSQAILPENSLTINCTMSARVKVGPTVYLQEERQDFLITVDTYINELGTIDRSTNEEINEVKKNLRYIDGKIASWEKKIGWLGKICSIAETLGNINYVLQTVKSVVYGVLVAVELIAPELHTAVNNIWKTVYGSLGLIHSNITQYVWPPGIIPGKGGKISPGVVVKWICMLYTCKHYDAGTLVQITTELVARSAKNNDKQPESQGYGQAEGDAATEYIDADGNKVTGVYRDSQGNKVNADGQYLRENIVNGETRLVATNENGIPVDKFGRQVSYESGKAEIMSGSDGKPIKPEGAIYGTPSDFAYGASSTTLHVVKAAAEPFYGENEFLDDISGGTYSASRNYPTEDMTVTLTAGRYGQIRQNANAINAQREMLINALNGHSWIINPYRSIHYDGLCIPAYIYNLKKERQIDCQYLRCLQAQDGIAIPKIMCDGNYKVNKCLYLDSAEYVLSGSHFMESFAKGLFDAFENTALSMVINRVYRGACKEDYSVPQTMNKIKSANLATDWRAAICGIAGAMFAARELVDTFKNPFVTAPLKGTGQNAGEIDYCEGLDYQTEYTENGEPRWYDG